MRTYSYFVCICKYLSKMYTKYKFFNIVVHKMLVIILKKIKLCTIIHHLVLMLSVKSTLSIPFWVTGLTDLSDRRCNSIPRHPN